VTDLADEYGTPLYVVNLPWLRRSHDEFVAPFKARLPRFALGTSYKTNPVPSVLEALHRLGTYAEVISDFELWLALRLGLSGERIIVNGPGKGRPMIERAVAADVKVINIDGFGEIDLVAEAAQRRGRPQPVGVRVVTSIGWSSQFGLSIAQGHAFDAFRRIRDNRWLTPVGMHLHIGTGLKSVDNFLQAAREVLELGRKVESELGVVPDLYDFGGGFGVATVRGLDEWDNRMVSLGYPAREALPADCPTPDEYASRLEALLHEFGVKGRPAPEIVLEPGRAITSGAQALVLRVVAVKDTGGARKLILDGGKNVTMPLGWENHKIFPTAGLDRPFEIPSDLFGPLCHPGDIVARHLRMPRLGTGDGVAIMDAGAYFVPNQMNFSNPRPAIVTVEKGHVQVARARESYDDIVRLDRPESWTTNQ
jgi:diaminopimelate decarboxylase